MNLILGNKIYCRTQTNHVMGDLKKITDKKQNSIAVKKLDAAESPCPDNEAQKSCRAITFKEQRLILKRIDTPKYYNFFYFCCCTGMRACEALSIKTRHIDKKNGVIRILLPDTKTKKHRRAVPFLPELLDSLTPSGGFLFPDVTDDGSRQYFCKLFKELEMDLSRHSCRHTFISVCSHIKIAENIIQQWAGHTDLKMTTDTYTHSLSGGTSPILAYLKKLKKTLKDSGKLKPH